MVKTNRVGTSVLPLLPEPVPPVTPNIISDNQVSTIRIINDLILQWQNRSLAHEQIRHVARGPGTFALQRTTNSITDSDEDNPYEVKIPPGVYDEELTVRCYVHYQGSGYRASIIKRDTVTGGLVNIGIGCSNKWIQFEGLNFELNQTFKSIIKNNASGATIYFKNCRFTTSIPDDYIYVWETTYLGSGNTVHFINCIFDGVYVLYPFTPNASDEVYIKNCIFKNTALHYVGGPSATTVKVYMSNCVGNSLRGKINTRVQSGAELYWEGGRWGNPGDKPDYIWNRGGTVHLTGVDYFGDDTNDYDLILNETGTTNINACKINGGKHAIRATGGTVNVSHSDISQHGSEDALYADGGIINADDCSITKANAASSALNLNNCSVVSATKTGGGLIINACYIGSLGGADTVSDSAMGSVNIASAISLKIYGSSIIGHVSAAGDSLLQMFDCTCSGNLTISSSLTATIKGGHIVGVITISGGSAANIYDDCRYGSIVGSGNATLLTIPHNLTIKKVSDWDSVAQYGLLDENNRLAALRQSSVARKSDYVSENFDYALDFEASNYVDLQDTGDLDFSTGDFTIAATVKMAPNANTTPVVGKRPIGSAGAVNGWYVYVSSTGVPRGQIGNDDGHYVNIASGIPVDDNAEHRVVWMFDRDGNMSIIVDGGAASTGSIATVEKTVDNSEDCCIRRAGVVAAYAFGDAIIIDEVVFFNKIWSADELAADYGGGTTKVYTGIEDGFVEGYRLNDGTGLTAISITGDNDGTLEGSMTDDDWIIGAINSVRNIISKRDGNIIEVGASDTHTQLSGRVFKMGEDAPADGDVWTWNEAYTKWTPGTILGITGLTPTDSNFIVGNGSAWVAESGNTARTSLGLGTGDSPTFVNLTLTGEILASSGTLTLGGTGGTNNENLTWDFESEANVGHVSSTTGLMRLEFDSVIKNIGLGGWYTSGEVVNSVGTCFQIVDTGNCGGGIGQFTAGTGVVQYPTLKGFRARGTLGSPAAVLANDILYAWGGYAYDGTVWNGPGAAITITATGNWAFPVNIPTKMDFIVHSTTAYHIPLTLESDGSLNVKGDTYFTGSGAGLPYGELWVLGNAVATTIAGAGTFVQFIGFSTNGSSNLTTPDHTNDHITIVKAGNYLCVCSFHIESVGAGAADIVSIEIRKNNGTVIYNNLHAHRKLAGGGGDIGSVSISGILPSLSANDTIEVWLTNDDNATDILVADANIAITQIGV